MTPSAPPSASPPRPTAPAFARRSCAMHIYTYPQLHAALDELLRFMGANDPSSCRPEDESCQLDTFHVLTRRQYTGDVPLWRALQACPRAPSAEAADAIVVPYLFGSVTTIKWGQYWRWSARQYLDGLRRNGSTLLASLPRLDVPSASKHVLLWTTDVEFAPWILRRLVFRRVLVFSTRSCS